MKTIQFYLPDFWAVALINGDTSHMADDDQGDFRAYHDARRFGVLACNVLTYTFDVS